MQYQQLDMFPKTDTQSIIQGDCLEVMKTFPDNHFNCVVTDPPYGLKFMSKKWDYQIPNQFVWEELLRICKPGTMMLCFGGTRTFHRLAVEIENSGWEIRDCLSWLYGSGFPKSHNHFGLEGYGTALKPSWEPILLCMKPLDGTFAHNAEKWGNAGLNINECRIGNEKRINNPSANKDLKKWRMNQGAKSKECIGRWPSNLILSEKAAEMLDVQSGNLGKSQGSKSGNEKAYGKWGTENYYGDLNPGFGDSGGVSRFFYCAKASSSERQGSTHPTMKPLKLMEYLIKLIAPPEALLLDPFAGSGSTLVACKNLEVDSIGIEISEEYCQIAKERIGM